eukprot:86305_1
MELQDDLQHIVDDFNTANKKHVKIHTFWYAFNRCIFRFSNWNMKQFVIQAHVKRIEDKKASPMTDEKQCAIYKFFGSAFNALCNIYQGNNYNPNTSHALISIVKLCLLSYDQSNNSNQLNLPNLWYLDVPLRWRLQNRGRLKLIHPDFYRNVAVQIFEQITNDIHKNMVYYDRKSMQDIAPNISLNKKIRKAFHDHIQSRCDVNTSIQPQQVNKVLEELSHRVSTRYLRCTIKRNQEQGKGTHVGQQRTHIKSLYSR